MSELSGAIKAKYGPAIQGRVDWIRIIDPEDQRALIEDGLKATQYGILGGKARAETARRSPEGKFVRADGTYQPVMPHERKWQDEPETDSGDYRTGGARYKVHGCC